MKPQPKSEADVQERLIEIALLPEDERAEIVLCIERLDQALRSICGSLAALTPFMKAVIKENPAEMKRDANVIGNPLCDGCAMKDDCGKKDEDIKRCHEYREHTPKCFECAFWDSVACMSVKSCKGGDRFEAQDV